MVSPEDAAAGPVPGAPAAGAAAAAWTPERIHLHMTELACRSTLTTQNAAICKDARAEALRDIDHNQVVITITVAEPDLG